MKIYLVLFFSAILSGNALSSSIELPILGDWKGVDKNGNQLRVEIGSNRIEISCAEFCEDLLEANRKTEFDVRSYFYAVSGNSSENLKFIPYQIEEDDLFLIELIDPNSIEVSYGWRKRADKIILNRSRPSKYLDKYRLSSLDVSNVTKRWRGKNMFGLKMEMNISKDSAYGFMELPDENNQIEVIEIGPIDITIFKSEDRTLENTYFMVEEGKSRIDRFELLSSIEMTQHKGGYIRSQHRFKVVD